MGARSICDDDDDVSISSGHQLLPSETVEVVEMSRMMMMMMMMMTMTMMEIGLIHPHQLSENRIYNSRNSNC